MRRTWRPATSDLRGRDRVQLVLVSAHGCHRCESSAAPRLGPSSRVQGTRLRWRAAPLSVALVRGDCCISVSADEDSSWLLC